MQLFLSTERKLAKQSILKEKCVGFLQEYKNHDHMRRIYMQPSDEGTFYLTHHAVFRSQDPEGKVRVVFNASLRFSSGFSLNEKLLPGPKLQSDL